MSKKMHARLLSFVLVVVMMFSTVSNTFAAEIGPVEPIDESVITEEPVLDEVEDEGADVSEDPDFEDVVTEDSETETESESSEIVEIESEELGTAPDVSETENIVSELSETDDMVSEVAETEELTISDYSTFLSSLKVLEGYAEDYARSHVGEDEVELVINYIRTGVAKYTDGSWNTLAGNEHTAFTAYVAEQDALYGTQAAGLKNLTEFTAPNGDLVEFGHMFGCMNISYYMAKTNPSATTVYADMSGWGGDLADLMEYTVNKVEVTDIETMAAEVGANYLGVDDPNAHGFGLIDIYGDLDAYYVMQNLTGGKTISTILQNYFNSNLTDERRAEYFVKNRLSGSGTKAEIREAVYNAYSSNAMIKNLEASKGLSNVDELRYACCYAFADYLYNLTGEMSDEVSNDYYTVYNTISSTLAPGVTQEINYALTADDKQTIFYIATADITRSDVSIHANYLNNTGEVWGMSRVRDQIDSAIARHTDPSSDKYVPNYTPVVGVNADFFNMTTGEPSGALVMEGVTYHTANNNNFFAILEDGSPIIASGSEWSTYADQVQEAVGGSIWLIKNGEVVASSSSDYYLNRASRTCVGLTADNKVVLMVMDGRQEPLSCGGSMEEIAQVMLDAGCVTAINLDGGGSTTFAAKQEGSDEVTVVNNPSDGYERSVSSSLMVVSTAKPSTEFDHALITADNDYMTIGTTVNVEAVGVSASGGSADLPEGAYLKVSDDTIGKLEDGVFTALANGDVDLLLVVNDNVIGKKTLHVVVPDNLFFEKEHLNVIYGVPTKLPLAATYNGNKVAINENDVVIFMENETAGNIDGLDFTAIETSGIRSMRIVAALIDNSDIAAFLNVDMYKENEAIFDFDRATGGDRQFAWLREVSNTNTTDEVTYYIADMEEPVETFYTFAMDMKEIPIPEVLTDLVALLPGGDDPDASAWGFLLQLAERISVLTNVTVKLQVDPNFNVDDSELTVVNEYFSMSSKEFDEETNTLTITFNWVDQTQAIDPTTANSSCILSGIKITPKEGTEDVLNPVIAGNVSYRIYLRASAVYNMAQDPATQEKYHIYPFENPDVIIGGSTEKGGYFGDTFVTMSDTFTIDRTGKEGWVKDANGNLSYFVDNILLTGIQKIPGYLDEGNEYYYDLGETGISKGKVNGLFEMDGKFYYAVQGQLKTGWYTLVSGEQHDTYYFEPDTGAAVTGEQTIDGYTYTFDDYILVRGQLVTDDTGTRYMWGGSWATQEWLTIDGNIYYAKQGGYFMTGLQWARGTDGSFYYFAFDEDGVWMKDLTGLYDYEGETYYVKNGYVIEYAGLVVIDGYYYYFNSSDIAVKNRSYFITKTNGLMAQGYYKFDEDGKMVIEEAEVTPTPTPEVTPTPAPEVSPTPTPEVTPTPTPGPSTSRDKQLTDYVWVEPDGDAYVKDESGNRVKESGTPVIGGTKYCVLGSGYLYKGWLVLGDWKMYFDPFTYEATTGFAEIGGKMYLFNDDGVMQNFAGTTVINGKKYWFSDDDASLKTGWLNLGLWKLYFSPENFEAATGLKEIDGQMYIFNEDGVMQGYAGTPVINGKKYWVSEEGYLKTGWLYLTNWKMYFDPETYEAKVGFAEIGDKMYLFNDDGVMQNFAGTTIINGKKYWFSDDDASLKTGWLNLGDWRLYFDPETYEGVTGLAAIDGKNYYFDENGVMLADTVVSINGKIYDIDANGVCIAR